MQNLGLNKKFKKSIHLENYLVTIKDISKRKQFTKLRISAHQLHIETGRHKKPPPPKKKLLLPIDYVYIVALAW